MQEPKQVILIRTDLKMKRGKEIGQGAHASCEAIADRLDDPIVKTWRAGSYAKIVLAVSNEEELVKLHSAAVAAGLPNFLVTDEGRTQFHGQRTKTAAAIGPGDPAEIDALTGHLKLR